MVPTFHKVNEIRHVKFFTVLCIMLNKYKLLLLAIDYTLINLFLDVIKAIKIELGSQSTEYCMLFLYIYLLVLSSVNISQEVWDFDLELFKLDHQKNCP